MSANGTGLTKTFAGIRALDGVDIELPNGAIHALVGANGSGKSTLVKTLTGVYRPDLGEIVVGQTRLPAILSPHQAGQLGIAVVHQEAPLIDSMTIAEGIALFRGYPTRRGRVLWDRLYAETAEMLDRFGVRVDPRQLGGELSPAERALVALVIALDQVKTGLELLILDEVTAPLPESAAELFLDHVTSVAASGVAVLMVTYRLKELHGRAKRVTVLRDGRVVHVGPAGDCTNHELIGMMIGRRDQPVRTESTAPSGAVRRLWSAAGIDAANADLPRAAHATSGDTITLEARHLAGRFMRDVSFSLRRGEIVGLAGLVESGITELVQVLGGLAPRRDGGFLSVCGRVLPAKMKPRDAIEARIALLPVDRLRSGGIASLSVKENALLPALDRYWHAGAREHIVLNQLIEELDIRPPRPTTLFGQLSGGNQQKLILGKWLLLHPAVLVLEDPTYGVDPNARAKMFEVLRGAAAEGVTILLLSTEPEQLAEMCSRVLILRNGVVAAELTGNDLNEETISQWCYA